jgi:catechol 2,3-dioxygenase-like lactoylglutathione lyase family enzyme
MTMPMLGVHVLFYSRNPDADRGFFSDVLGLKSVDVGGGWLIFGLPRSEAAVHPMDEGSPGEASGEPGMLGSHVYLMCEDLEAFMRTLADRGVQCGAVHTERWGIVTTISLPSGGTLGLYQPKHPTALNL